MLKSLNIFSFVCLLFVFSGCGFFRTLKKTKIETTTIIKLDTVISILPNKEIFNEIPLNKFLNFDTLKIENQRNEILVFLEAPIDIDARGTTPKVKILNKEKAFDQPIHIQKTTTTKETVKEKTETTLLKKLSKFIDIIFYFGFCYFFYRFIMFLKNIT